MKTESYDPREIVKANASVYRDSELARIEFNLYNGWLQSHRTLNEKSEKSACVGDDSGVGYIHNENEK